MDSEELPLNKGLADGIGVSGCKICLFVLISGTERCLGSQYFIFYFISIT